MSILQTIDNDIKICEMYAQYWMAMATTGVATKRKIYHGTNGDELTDAEKIDDAMNTALSHIRRMAELVETKKSLINEEV